MCYYFYRIWGKELNVGLEVLVVLSVLELGFVVILDDEFEDLGLFGFYIEFVEDY